MADEASTGGGEAAVTGAIAVKAGIEASSMNANPGATNAEATRSETCKKRAVVATIVCLIIFVVVDAFTSKLVGTALEDFIDWLATAGAGGVCVFAVVYAAATVLFLPGSILTIGAGFAFSQAFGQGAGVALGSLAVFLGATTGATASFLLGRYALRETVEAWAQKYRLLRALDRTIATSGLKIVTLLRLSPLIPFNAFNYIAGLTAVSLRNYVLASAGMIPGTVAFVFIGSTVSSVKDVSEGGDKADADEDMSGTVRVVIWIAGMVATLAAVVWVSVIAKRQLQLAIKEADDLQASDGSVSFHNPAATSTATGPSGKAATTAEGDVEMATSGVGAGDAGEASDSATARSTPAGDV